MFLRRPPSRIMAEVTKRRLSCKQDPTSPVRAKATKKLSSATAKSAAPTPATSTPAASKSAASKSAASKSAAPKSATKPVMKSPPKPGSKGRQITAAQPTPAAANVEAAGQIAIRQDQALAAARAALASPSTQPAASAAGTSSGAARAATAHVKTEQHHELGPAPPVVSGLALGRSRGALRNAFNRSLGRMTDPRTKAGSEGSRGVTKATRCPHDIAVQMVAKKDEAYWLQVWCANGMDWGSVQIWMDKRKEQIKQGKKKFAWLTLGQWEDLYKSKAVAAAMAAKAKKDPNRVAVHPEMPEEEEAMLFWGPVEFSSEEITRQTNTMGIKGNAELSGQSAGLLMNRFEITPGDMGSDPVSFNNALPFGNLPSEPAATQGRSQNTADATEEVKAAEEMKAAEEVKAAEEEEEKNLQASIEDQKKKLGRKKALDAAREAQRKCPKYQSEKWLTGLTSILSQLNDAIGKAKKANKMPGKSNLTYAKEFEEKKIVLLEKRTAIEDAKNVKSKLKLGMNNAQAVVCKVVKDLKAFKASYDAYYR